MELASSDIDGRVLRYADSGGPQERALVLLHAFPMGVRTWTPQMTAFAGWRVVAPALAGFDGSEPIAEPSMEDYAQQVDRLMRALGIGHAIVGGLSMGGYVAFALLRSARDRVRGLVLADTRSASDTPQAMVGRRRAIDLVHEQGSAAIADDVLPKLLGATTQTRDEALKRDLHRMIAAQPPAAIAGAALAMMRRSDAGPLLPSIDVPALIIVGEEDTVTPPLEAEVMHSAIRGSELVRIPAAGHLANLEAPKAFNDAVRGWLGRIG